MADGFRVCILSAQRSRSKNGNKNRKKAYFLAYIGKKVYLCQIIVAGGVLLIQMRILIDDNMSRCSEAEVARLAGIAPSFRYEEAMRYKHLFGRYACLRTWEMLYVLVGEEANSPWRYNEYGKPFLSGGCDFSISHCRSALAVGVADEGGQIGVDIESVRALRRELVERTMNREEQDYIFSAAQPELAFTALWTKKEAVLKMHGTGIIDDLYEVLTRPSEPYMLKSVDSVAVIGTADPDIILCPSAHERSASVEWVLSAGISRLP